MPEAVAIKQVTTDLDAFLAVLPPNIAQRLTGEPDLEELLEVVLDLGRPPEARFFSREAVLSPQEVTAQDLDYVAARVSSFGGDNRAGRLLLLSH